MVRAVNELNDQRQFDPKEPVDTAAEFEGLAKTRMLNKEQVVKPHEKCINFDAILKKAITSYNKHPTIKGVFKTGIVKKVVGSKLKGIHKKQQRLRMLIRRCS